MRFMYVSKLTIIIIHIKIVFSAYVFVYSVEIGMKSNEFGVNFMADGLWNGN